jgi:hypothetical protein
MDALLDQLRPTGLDGLAFPRHLLGAFRRKSISFCTGVTDESTIVYWFQSKSFSIDLRLPDAAATAVTDRQGWIGDTLWDDERRELSWRIDKSYQPHNQWPEPATLSFIGNCVLEFAPSGAYVEDWRQQSSHGPLLGLRLIGMRDETSGSHIAMDGGLVIAGDHIARAQSRLPQIDDALRGASSLEDALASGLVSEADIESYEVSVAIDGAVITHSTRPDLRGTEIDLNGFSVRPDGIVAQETILRGKPCLMLYTVDVFEPDFTFGLQTASTPEAMAWMAQEARHLARHATIAR